MHAERLGRYELVRHLASGGMGSVYLARLSGLGGFERHVVLKTLKSDGLDEALVPMFLDEARLVATLHHQHIAQVFEVGCDDRTYFLAMEYVHGETVRTVLETAGKHGQILPLDFSLTVVCAAAAGLHHAHERRNPSGSPLGIVHRDVTPSNVIVSYDGSVKLIDFGIAKANDRSTRTRSGIIKGKAGYMAPEQVKGYPVDRRSDVFALGVLAYELTTQRRAFHADSQFEQLERIANGSIVPPSELVSGFPVELEDVVMRALEVDPDDRYPDANALRAELERVTRELGLSLGEGIVIRVLDELYGPRPEPWLVAPGLIDYDITPSIADMPFAIEVVEPVGHHFARHSDSHEVPEVIDDLTDALAIDAPFEPVPSQPIAATMSLYAPQRGSLRTILGSTLVIACIAAAIVAITHDADPPQIALPAPVTKVSRGRPAERARIRTVIPPAPEPVPPPRPSVVQPPVTEPLAMPPPAVAPDRVMLDVVTDPPDATVLLDGVRLGKTPYHAEVRTKQTAWLKVRRSDRIPMKIKVSLERDVSWNVTLRPRR